jgi:hypothetical protein
MIETSTIKTIIYQDKILDLPINSPVEQHTDKVNQTLAEINRNDAKKPIKEKRFDTLALALKKNIQRRKAVKSVQ